MHHAAIRTTASPSTATGPVGARAGLGGPIRSGLAALSFAAAAIHVAVIGEHFRQFWLYGVFFLALASVQALWGALVLVRPTRRTIVLGGAGSGAIVLVWIISRTAGIPVGPEGGGREALGLLDSVATLMEVAILAGVAALTKTRLGRHGISTTRMLLAVSSAWLAVGAVTTFTLVAATARGHEVERLSVGVGTGASFQPHAIHLVMFLVALAAVAVYSLIDWRTARRAHSIGPPT